MTKSKTEERTEVTTRTQTTLSPVEEKVVRMRHGYTHPLDTELEQLTDSYPELADELRAIEERAFAAVGSRNSTTKRNIVSSLKSKPKSRS